MEQFEYPKKISWEKDTYRQTYGKIIVEPLERGFAITVGNCLRRVLLSAIPGAAITSVKIDGIAHEFSAIPGVKEDVTDVVLNLKQVSLKSEITDLPRKFIVTIEGKTELVAGDLFPGPEISVLNPKLHIATLSEGAKLKLELTVSQGFGYVPVVRIVQEGVAIGTIPLAASFSPVTRVSFRTESTRVGQRVDYERLILEIWTTGAIAPMDAVKYATAILNRHFNFIAGEAEVETKKAAKEDAVDDLMGKSLADDIFSTRLSNSLKSSGIVTVKDLVGSSRAELEKVPSLGDKAWEEIEKFLKKTKLQLRENATPAKKKG